MTRGMCLSNIQTPAVSSSETGDHRKETAGYTCVTRNHTGWIGLRDTAWMDWEIRTELLVKESTPVNPISHLALGSVLVVIEKFKGEFR